MSKVRVRKTSKSTSHRGRRRKQNTSTQKPTLSHFGGHAKHQDDEDDKFNVVVIRKSPSSKRTLFTFVPSSSPRALSRNLRREYRESAPSKVDCDSGAGSAYTHVIRFTSNADNVSETKIKDDVLALNHLLQNLVLNTMASVNGSHRGRRYKDKLDCPPELPANDDMSPLEIFYANGLCYGTVIRDLNLRDLLTEALLRDKMCRLLYNAFFGGGHFFGLGLPKDIETFLDGIFDIIQTEERLPVSQSWRSVAASAILKKNSSSKRLSAAAVILELERAFCFAHPFKSSVFHKRVSKALREEEVTINEILDLSSHLTVNLQRDIVSCDMRVTIAPSLLRYSRSGWYDPFDHDICRSAWSDIDTNDGDKVLGTFEFGLEYIDETKAKTIVIKPEVILRSVLDELVATDSEAEM